VYSNAEAVSQRQATATALSTGGTTNDATSNATVHDQQGNSVSTSASVTTYQGEASTLASVDMAGGGQARRLAGLQTASVATLLPGVGSPSTPGTSLLAGGMSVASGSNAGAFATYHTSMTYTFNYDQGVDYAHLAFGLSGFSGVQGSSFGSLSFTITGNGGQALYSQSFASMADAASYFQDHTVAVDISAWGWQRQVGLDLAMTNNGDLYGTGSSASFSYNLSSATAPVPEPEEWLMWMSGLGALAAWRRRKAKQAKEAAVVA
jgi:MYXO-CTERM domain-containing protein